MSIQTKEVFKFYIRLLGVGQDRVLNFLIQYISISHFKYYVNMSVKLLGIV